MHKKDQHKINKKVAKICQGDNCEIIIHQMPLDTTHGAEFTGNFGDNLYICDDLWYPYISFGDTNITMGIVIGATDPSGDSSETLKAEIPVAMAHWDPLHPRYNFSNLDMLQVPDIQMLEVPENNKNDMFKHLVFIDEKKLDRLSIEVSNKERETYGYVCKSVIQLMLEIKYLGETYRFEKEQKPVDVEASNKKKERYIKQFLSLLFPYKTAIWHYEGSRILYETLGYLFIQPQAAANDGLGGVCFCGMFLWHVFVACFCGMFLWHVFVV